MIKFGDKARDLITGFEGIVIGKIDYLYGCAHVQLAATEMKDGQPQKTQTFDEQRVEVVEKGALKITPEPMECNFKLGDKVRDKVNGFTGIVLAINNQISGLRFATVEPDKLHEGKPIPAEAMETARLERVEEKEKPMSRDVKNPSPGGPFSRSI